MKLVDSLFILVTRKSCHLICLQMMYQTQERVTIVDEGTRANVFLFQLHHSLLDVE